MRSRGHVELPNREVDVVLAWGKEGEAYLEVVVELGDGTLLCGSVRLPSDEGLRVALEGKGVGHREGEGLGDHIRPDPGIGCELDMRGRTKEGADLIGGHARGEAVSGVDVGGAGGREEERDETQSEQGTHGRTPSRPGSGKRREKQAGSDC